MATHQQVPTDPIDLSSGKAADHVERVLDQAIEDSFPNSDPVSLAMPHSARETGRSVTPSTTTMMLVGGGLLALIAVIALRR